MKRLLIVFSLFLLECQLRSQDKWTLLDAALTQAADSSVFHGQVLIAKKGEIKLNKAYGLTSEGSHYTNDSLIEIESVSKGFTALAILKLCEQQALELDTELQELFPTWPYPDVTIHNLLNHSSGLPHFLGLVFDHWPEDKYLTNEGFIDLIVQHPPKVKAQPGDEEAYNSFAYLLLASVIEKVSGMSYEQFVRSFILEPAGMSHTFFRSELSSFNKESGPAGADDVFKLVKGEGNMLSTASDLFKLDRALSAGKIIGQPWLDKMHQISRLGNGKQGRYGYGGSVINNSPADLTFQYFGQGATSVVFTRYLKREEVCIVLHARSVEYAYPIHEMIQSIWREQPYTVPQKRAVHRIDESLLKQYIGDYGENGFMHVRLERGVLFIQPDGNPGKMELVPTSDTTFVFRDQPVYWQFYLDKASNVTGFGPQGEPASMMKRQ